MEVLKIEGIGGKFKATDENGKTYGFNILSDLLEFIVDCAAYTAPAPTETFIKDIDVTRLDIKTWLAVCDASGTYRNVAVARWVENLNPTLRGNITLTEWLEIAEIAGYKKGWALNKFEDYGA